MTESSSAESEQWWLVHYELWPTNGDAHGQQPDPDRLGRHTTASVYKASGDYDAINAALYYTRGFKSNFEMAEILSVDGPFEDQQSAQDWRWSEYE